MTGALLALAFIVIGSCVLFDIAKMVVKHMTKEFKPANCEKPVIDRISGSEGFVIGAIIAAACIGLGWFIISVGCQVGELKKNDESQEQSLKYLGHNSTLTQEFRQEIERNQGINERTATAALKAANEAHKRLDRIERFLAEEEK